MLIHLQKLFLPYEHNNHKPKILHLPSLTFFIILILCFQLFITIFHRVKPGVLGFAANIDVPSIVDFTNKYRGQNGLTTLKIDEKLSEAARQKASDMFAKNYWAHYSPAGTTPWWFFDNAGYTYLYAGENLARDFGDSESVIKAWLASPTHRDNLLSPRYKDIGVAVVNGVLNGEETTLVVQLFGTSSGGTPLVSSKAATQGVSQNAVPELALVEAKMLPLISSFILTKSLNISLLILLLLVLFIDGLFIFRTKIVRISGRSFIHFSFLAIILGVIILFGNGKIL